MILSIYIVDLIHAQLSDCDEYLVNQIVSYSPLDFPEEWLKLPLHCHFRNQQGNYLFGPQLAAYQDHTCCFIFKGFTFLVLPVELVRLLVIQGLMRNFWDAHPSAQTTATMHAALVHLQGFQFSQHKLHRSIMPHRVKNFPWNVGRIICYLSWIAGLDYSSRVSYFCSSSCQSMQGILGGRCADCRVVLSSSLCLESGWD